MDNGGIPDNWKPLPSPAIGSIRWKRDVLERSFGRTHNENKSFDCGDVGIFCCWKISGGWDYFWVNKENHVVAPKIDWKELMEQSIKNGYYPNNEKQ